MKLITNIDKFGTAGLFLTAIFSPCCFPIFAFAASALGLGSFELLAVGQCGFFRQWLSYPLADFIFRTANIVVCIPY